MSERECVRLNRRFLNEAIALRRSARLLKKSTIGCPFNADAKNCSTVIDQLESEDDGVVGLPLRSGD